MITEEIETSMLRSKLREDICDFFTDAYPDVVKNSILEPFANDINPSLSLLNDLGTN